MNWLITGGCGFIGSALTHALLAGDSSPSIRLFDNLSVGDGSSFDPPLKPHVLADRNDWSDELTLVKGDILDLEALEVAMSSADFVVHLAANTGVGPSIEDPFADCETNVKGTLNVLEAARRNSVKRVVFASSGAPLGMQIPPLNENMAPNPASPYGASKLAGEGYCRAYFHSFGVETVVLRFSNVYGPGSGNKSSVVAKLLREALAGEEWTIYGDGKQTRDFIFIDDLVAAITLGTTSADVGGEVFQIATNVETNMLGLVEHLGQALAEVDIALPNIKHIDLPPGDVLRNFSDTSKAKAMLGWSPRVELSSGLRVTVESFLSSDQS